MWTVVITFLAFSPIYAYLSVQLVELGERAEIYVGPDVVTWKRIRDDNDAEEFVKYCEPYERAPICYRFVGKNNISSIPATYAHVNKDGTLVIESVKESDIGRYSSPDQTPHVSGL
ncbi:unnamed protein product [Strongylus vulgaris]|uniref:Uncharacterized protein n=1 Tax=Strongylus vulgaris TaxID=40348 RepID=A0A3P7JE95_STRVU|nr:unnamed protein product [Strongylus vulgaris]